MAESIIPTISRQKAISQGLKRYFTGAPCVNGHVDERNTGKNNECIACKKIRAKAYSELRKKEKSIYDKRYREENNEYLARHRTEYRTQNKDKINERARAARKSDPARFQEYKNKRKDKIKCEIKAWRERNKDHVNAYQKRHVQKHKEARSNYWLASVLRMRLSMAIRVGEKSGSAVRNLGCTISRLKSHLENQFKEGMSWDNWGRKGWHIDHIKPLSSFDLNDSEQLKIACHYTNLQPLWAFDNISKGAKVS